MARPFPACAALGEGWRPYRHVLATLVTGALLGPAHASANQEKPPPETDHYAVMVNAKNTTNALSLEALRRVYLGDQRHWESGKEIDLVLNRSGSPEKKLLLSMVYDMTEGQLKKHWIERIYRNQISEPPPTYPSRETIVQAVVRDPRAIALVLSSAVSGVKGIKILAIDGKQPGESGYPLILRREVTPDPNQLAEAQDARAPIEEPEEDAGLEDEDLGFQIAPHLVLRGFTHFEVGTRTNPSFSSSPENESAFTVGGLDLFLTSRLGEKLSFLAETVYEPTEEGEYVLDVERAILKYDFGEQLNAQIGRLHTTIGYWNEAYHHGEWLQTSAGRPLILAFEDDGGLLPVHLVGLVLKGRHASDWLTTDYTLEVGNGRGPTADSLQIVDDANDSKAVNLALAVQPLRITGLSLGGGWYVDSIPENTDASIGPVHTDLDERIWNGNLRYHDNGWEALAEFFSINHEGQSLSTDSHGYYVQLSKALAEWTPYARYEATAVDDQDPYFEDKDDQERVLIGLRWDFGDWSALKLQYAHTNVTDDTSGNEDNEEELLLQLSFAF